MKRFLIIAILILLSGSINQSCTKEFTGYQLCGVIQDYPLGEGKIVKLCYLPESGQPMLNIESYGYSPIGSKGNFNIVSPAAPSPDKVMPLRAIFGDGINMTSPSAGGTIGLLRIFNNESATFPIGATTYDNNLYGIGLSGPGSCSTRHIYVSMDVKITGTGTSTYLFNKTTTVCDLDLKAGWNNYYMRVDSIAHYSAFMIEPPDMNWIFWDSD